MKFEKFRIEDKIDIRNPYELIKIGSPLNDKEKNRIFKSVCGGFFEFFHRYYFFEKIQIRKEDFEYYVVFRGKLVVVDTLDELIELVYFEWCLYKGKYGKLRKFVPKSFLLKDNTLKTLVVGELKRILSVLGDDDDLSVVDLLNYIKSYF
jgi:hypothetical protein